MGSRGDCSAAGKASSPSKRGLDNIDSIGGNKLCIIRKSLCRFNSCNSYIPQVFSQLSIALQMIRADRLFNHKDTVLTEEISGIQYIVKIPGTVHIQH